MKNTYKLLCAMFVCVFITTHFCHSTGADMSDRYKRIESLAFHVGDEEINTAVMSSQMFNRADDYTAPYVTSQPVTYRSLGFAATGELPVVSYAQNRQLEEETNQKIDKIYNDQISAMRRTNIKTATFSYSQKRYAQYFAVLINITTGTGRPAQSFFTVTIDMEKEKIITLTDILGINALQICDYAVSDEILKNAAAYNSSFTGADDERSFYIENNTVYLVFNEGEIAPASSGIQFVRIALSSVKTVSLERGKYIIRENFYNLKFIPLREICEALDYKVSWKSETREILITKGSFETAVALDKNNYYRTKNSPRSLEATPIVEGGITYVPLSFFDQILDAAYSEDEDGNIIFSAYAR